MDSAEISTKNITIDDVRAVLGDTDPHQTNSSRLRAILGRGSNATIQKYLDAIRAERIAAQQPVEAPTVPVMPEEFKVLWTLTYTAAVATVRTRLDAVVSERDALAVAVSASRQDLVGLQETIEQAEQVAAEQAAARAADAQAIAAHAEQIAALTSAAEKAAAEQSATYQTKIDAFRMEAGMALHALEIEKRDHALSKATLQATIDRLTDQVGELKSMLHAPAPVKK